MPDTLLEPYWYYYYYLSGFADIAGNNGNTGATYFLTSGIADTEPPTLVSIAPANGATAVPVNARIRVLMSEPIDATSASAAIQLTPVVAGTTTVSPDHLSLLFTPAANLAVSTGYTVQISGLRDSSGNTMAPVVSSFTTSASRDARHDGTDGHQFQPDQRRHWRIGELANRHDRERADPIVRLRQYDAGLRQPSAVRHDPACRHLHAQCIRNCRDVHAAGSVPRWNADPCLLELRWNDDGSGRQTRCRASARRSRLPPSRTPTPPTVVMVTPPDGATGIGPAAVVTLTFSEPLHPSTVNNNTFALFSGATEISSSISRSADNTTVFLTTTLPFDALITVVATGDVT